MSKNESNLNSRIFGLAVILVLFLIAVVVLTSPPKKNPQPRDFISRNPDKALFYQAKKMEIESRIRELENQKLAPSVGESVFMKKKELSTLGVDHSPDANELNAYNDLNRYPKELRVFAPRNQIEGQISDEIKENEINDERKKEFVRQYIENARKKGYDVKISPDYKVISVQPIIRSPSGQIGPAH